MKRNIYIILFSICLFYSCNNNDPIEEKVTVTLNFTHHWDGIPVSSSDFNSIKFTNANGEKISIEHLRYLVSNISLIGSKNYQLINVGENSGTSSTILDLTSGSYNISFRFGFNENDNTDGIYQDLNSASFNVPGMLGGGYHFMQFDGKYLDINNEEVGFNYHTIRAVDRTDPNNLVLQDTSFDVNLGDISITKNTTIEIKMNIAEWFKNPNTWNLNELNTTLMPNFEAQKMMSENGTSVFSLGENN